MIRRECYFKFYLVDHQEGRIEGADAQDKDGKAGILGGFFNFFKKTKAQPDSEKKEQPSK